MRFGVGLASYLVGMVFAMLRLEFEVAFPMIAISTGVAMMLLELLGESEDE